MKLQEKSLKPVVVGSSSLKEEATSRTFKSKVKQDVEAAASYGRSS